MTELTKKPTVRKPRKPKTVAVTGGDIQVKQITRDTPIVEIMQDAMFDDCLISEINSIRKLHHRDGKRLRPEVLKVVEIPIDKLKVHAMDVLCKTSNLPSSQRNWILHIVNAACIRVIEFYNPKNSK